MGVLERNLFNDVRKEGRLAALREVREMVSLLVANNHLPEDCQEAQRAVFLMMGREIDAMIKREEEGR